MSVLQHIESGRQPKPRRVMLYGTHGIGKSTFGSMADKPVFLQTEDGLGEIDCDKLPVATRYGDILASLSALYSEDHGYTTVVIDSLDWLERLIFAEVCAKRGVESIRGAQGRLHEAQRHRRRERQRHDGQHLQPDRLVRRPAGLLLCAHPPQHQGEPEQQERD